MKKGLPYIFCFLLLISCNQIQKTTITTFTATSVNLIPSFTSTPFSTQTVTPTSTYVPLYTPTSNFDNLTPQFLTPSPPENCPTNLDGKVDFPEDLQLGKSSLSKDVMIKEFENLVISTLNEGKTTGLLNIFQKLNISYYLEDVTNDGVDEVIVDYINMNVFSCINDKYINLRTFSSDSAGWDDYILKIRDLNSNGVSDLIIVYQQCGGCISVYVYEWNGKDFESLILDYQTYYSENKILAYNTTTINGYFEVFIEDINKDGFYEIILDNVGPSYLGAISGGDGPYRKEKVVYMWNGENFVWHSQEYYPPNFKFEAVLDGDIQTLRGLYDKALQSYQAAIFDEKLKSWDEEVWLDLIWNRTEGDFSYPDIQKMPFNQKEYDQLSAYSRYRIMILHLIRGWDNDAEIVYKNLIELYPKDTNGYPYVEMATEFWNEYQISKDFYNACEKAIEYTQENEVILEPFGWHGLHYYSYLPANVCPFTNLFILIN